VRGIVAMSASMSSFFVNDMCVKQATSRLPLGEILFVRGLMCIAALAIAITIAREWWSLKHLADRRMAWRLLGEIFASLFYIAGFIALPVAEATAVYQVTPLASTAVAAIVFKEKVGWRRWLAIAVGFAGVLTIIRPGSHAFSPAAMVILASVAFVILRDFITSRLPKEITTLMIIFSAVVTMTLVGPALLPFEPLISPQPHWVPLDAISLGYLAASGVFLLAGYFLLIIAVRSADMSAIAPFRYTILIWSFSASMVIYGLVPDAATWIGAAIIVASGVYLFHRERVRAAEKATSGT
jgi:drug/metabolite transporter (DMT)-like permease